MSDELTLVARRVLAAFTGGATVRSYTGEEAEALAKLEEALTELPRRESERCVLRRSGEVYRLDCRFCGDGLGATASKSDAIRLWEHFHRPGVHFCGPSATKETP